jgi:hypothetical protein
MTPLNKLLDPAKLTGNLVGNLQSALGDMAKNASGALSSISNPATALGKLTGLGANPADMLGKLATNATAEFSKVQTLLDSVGNMPGQIKAPVMATGTINSAAITAKLGKLLGDNRLPIPAAVESGIKAASSAFQEAQQSALGKVKSIEADIKVLKLKISGIDFKSPGATTQLKNLNEELNKLNTSLLSAQDSYERTITSA